MAILKAKAQQNTGVSRVSEGGEPFIRATRDGSLFIADWKLAAIMEGRGFQINVGALSTPVTGGGAGGTAVDLDTPEFVISVPKGTSIIPIRTEVTVGLPVGAADDNEVDILLAVDQDAAWDATGTAVTEVIYNMNTLNNRASNCTARSAFSATMTTDPVEDIELAHYTKVFESFSATGAHWTESILLYEPEAPPIINGPAMYIGHWGGTAAAHGFATVQWIEFPSTAFSG